MHVDLVRVTASDGVRLEGAWQSAEKRPTDTPGIDAFLLIHGTGSNFYGSTLFETLAARLQEMGSSVLTVNTRGHDVVSAVAASGGARRLGAAYERVDDCRLDLAAWMDFLTAQGCRRIGLIGHSLGAIKAIYSQAIEPHPAVAAVVGISPARLSYRWFSDSKQGELFRQTMDRAESLVAQGEGESLMQVEFPLPYLVTAAGYIDKYGPAERYNVIPHLPRLTCPTLVTFGSVEVQSNVAFAGLPEALEQAAAGQAAKVSPGQVKNLSHERPQIVIAVLAGGDHVYSGVRAELTARIERWLNKLSSA